MTSPPEPQQTGERQAAEPAAAEPRAAEPSAAEPSASALRASEHPARSQARDVPLDSHLHSELSPDSAVPIELYAADAAARGIAEIAITDHLDFHPGAPAVSYADHARREREVRGAAERWAGRVAIRFGVEITYERRHEDEIRRHLASHQYDYSIGSVHSQADSPYTRERLASFVQGLPLSAAAAPYFDEVADAIRSGLFDTLGHLDYVKRYLVDWFPPAAFAAAPDLYEPILRLLAESGMALEVNASGLRHRTGETYPASWAVRRFRELGGSRVTTGSDAHAAAQFAFGLEEAYEIVAEAGFAGLSLRRGAEREDIGLPVRFLRPAAVGAGRSASDREREAGTNPSSRHRDPA